MLLSVEFWITLKTYLKGAPFYNASAWGKSDVVDRSSAPNLLETRFEGLSDLRVCALMRLPIPVCRPSMNWVRFLVPVSMVTDRMSGQGIDLRNILRHSVGGHDRFPGIRRESPDVLDSLRDAIRREKGPVAIDLTELTLVDREAVTLLATSEVNGIELRNCSAYLREWINEQRESR